ncbi:MAG: hypothetical protein LBN08_06495 [Lactobacillales bacterium]|jgi:uncharacterized protein YpmB|nr:hypothetical protein [Lactobacillales bacterium]
MNKFFMVLLRDINRHKRFAFFYVLFVIILTFSIGYYVKATRQVVIKNAQVVKLAHKTGMKHVEAVGNFSWDTVYNSALGDVDGHKVYYLFSPRSDTVIELDAEKAIDTKALNKRVIEDYKATKIDDVALGMFEDKPVFEVGFETKNGDENFILVDYYTGAVVHEVKDI